MQLLKSVLRKILGVLLVALGIVGLFLPVLQGVILILLGLYLLGVRPRWLRQRVAAWKARHHKKPANASPEPPFPPA